jgi:hypothetical protein
MLLESLRVPVQKLESEMGWSLKPQGACKGEVCIPLPDGPKVDGVGTVDAEALARKLRMPLLHDEKHSTWALGPEGGGRALTTAEMPEVVLPDLDGNPFDLSSLRGQKVLLVAWASW